MALHYSSEKNVQLMVALLKAHGIRKVIASPGTTNITFIGSLMHDPFFEIYSSVDERSAAYMACGLAEESGEPVVISCTGATASRNYFPGLTEAYYRKLPILAITSTREECKVGHLIDQQIDRTQQPKDTVVCSEHLQVIKDDEDWWNCTIKANRAILALTANGGGPSHINLPTTYSRDFSVKELPAVRKICRYYSYQELPEIGKRDVAIFIGTHRRMTQAEVDSIDRFCEVYDAVVFCDSSSGYYGKYRLTMFGAVNNLEMDLLIHIGSVSCRAYGCKPKEVWRVDEDGDLKDTFRKLTNVFAMPDKIFFDRLTTGKSTNECSKYQKYLENERNIYSNIRELKFSNSWIASHLYDKIPHNSLVHLGIVSSFFVWDRFKLDPSLTVVSNQGGFGIDGNLSTTIGASLANPDKLCFCFLGDLAFFYDMNSLGNRHIGNNLRILLINNGNGVIFRKPSNIGSIFKEETEKFMSAGGHFGKQSSTLVKGFCESLGFKYMTASNKDELIKCEKEFLCQDITQQPMLIEVFVSTEDEINGDNIYDNKSGLKGAIKSFLGEDLLQEVKKFVKGDSLGSMIVDHGHN